MLDFAPGAVHNNSPNRTHPPRPRAASGRGCSRSAITKKSVTIAGTAADDKVYNDNTLATLGTPNPGALNVLYDARSGQRLFAKAALLHAMAKSEMSPAQIKTLGDEVSSRLREGPNGIDIDEADDDRYDAMLESHARTLAMVLRAFLAVNPKDPRGPRLARQLLSLRQANGAWRTTQEDGWALLALSDYRKLQEAGMPAFDARTHLGSSEILSSVFPRGALREDKVVVSAEALVSKGSNLSFDVSGGGRLFYAAELKYATAALPTRARDEGLFVTKYVRGVLPAAVTAALATIPKKTSDVVNAGDLVIVDLLFESAEPRERVVLDDPLPAGLEALDYDLDTTSKTSRDASAKQLEVRVDHGRLIVEPVARRARFESAMARSFKKHDKTFKALAK